MNKFKQTVVWLVVRPWPIWTMACIASIHLLVVWRMPVDIVMTNKIASAAMQIIGGLIIIFSVDSNLGLFRKQNLVGAILAWFNENPFCARKPVTVTVHACTGNIVASGASVSISTAHTVEERIAELKRITDQLRTDIEARHQASMTRIDEAKQELVTLFTANQAAVYELAQKVETATVGGFKQQAFGVMLAVWGAGTSVFA